MIHSERPLPVRLAALVLGCVILAFGMTIVICSEAGTGPNDLVGVRAQRQAGQTRSARSGSQWICSLRSPALRWAACWAWAP